MIHLKYSITLFTFICYTILSFAGDSTTYKFRLKLKDKGTEQKNFKPKELLSEKALKRKAKYNIAINTEDYPFSEIYLSEIEKKVGPVVSKSKWHNTLVVEVKDSLSINKAKKLPYVEDIKFVWKGQKAEPKPILPTPLLPIKDSIDQDNYYGKAATNIQTINGEFLHNKGFKGEGMTIAVIDAGFNNVRDISYFDNLKLQGAKSFVHNGEYMFQQENQHGTNVLSCIATNKPQQFVGTAPEANIWLLNTEDFRSEFPIEEDYWAEAIEYADSIGVDVVNTSLGYITFDAPAKGFLWKEMDGKTALISSAATKAAEKGILIVTSAGNSGHKPWGKISAPADAINVLTVAAMKSDSTIADFSSRGLTADLRLKPDVSALGVKAAVINDQGQIDYKNGTSFSSPIMCGIVTCLWQAFPELNNKEIIDCVRASSNKFDNPNIAEGFGIPNMEKAYKIAEELVKEKMQ